ncbi:MAG TPA: hypothetical protein VKA46_38995 [Gemmataceae bacterium]|nr:hypothetical protein [Gemmataceae bacterium]
MPAVPITSQEQYEKAIEVLTRVGGTWQGVGQKERFLLVNEAQYQALLEVQVITHGNAGKGQKPAKNSRAGG